MITRYKTNGQITAPELRVIDENGENLGVLKREDALRMAQERGLDLIEIAPKIKPPVAKITNYDKFRYKQEKEEKKQRLATKAAEMKQVRISAKAAKNDLMVKADKVNKFLEKGSQVEIFMVLRGREKANRDWARTKLDEFTAMLRPDHKVVTQPKYIGRGFVMQVSK